MICGMAIIALLVLHLPQPLGCSPPGSILALRCCCGLLRLTVMLDGGCSVVAGWVFRCSEQEPLDFCCRLALCSVTGTGSLGLLCRLRCVHGTCRRKFASGRRVLFPAVLVTVFTADWLFPTC